MDLDPNKDVQVVETFWKRFDWFKVAVGFVGGLFFCLAFHI